MHSSAVQPGNGIPGYPADDVQESIHGVNVVRWNPTRVDSSTGTSAGVSNFGDLLGPAIVEALTAGYAPPAVTPRPRLLSVGSVMHYARDNDVVWGSGVNGKIPLSELTASRLDIRAVRGPRTRRILRERGHTVPSVYGDPALLLPRLFPELAKLSTSKVRPITIVPNFNDLADTALDDQRVISPRDELWTVLRGIVQSEFVIGSSLHAIIVAEAFGIPARLVASTTETYLKGADYYAGTGRSRIVTAVDIDEAIGLGGAVQGEFDLDGLIDSFPFDLWTGYEPPAVVAPGQGVDTESYAEIARERLALAWEDREYNGVTDRELAGSFVDRMVTPLLASAAHLDTPDFDAAVDAAADYLSLLSPEALESIPPVGEEWIGRDYSTIRRSVMLRERGDVSEVVSVAASDGSVQVEGLLFRGSPDGPAISYSAVFVDDQGESTAVPAAEFGALTDDGSLWSWTLSLDQKLLGTLVGREMKLTIVTPDAASVSRCRSGVHAEIAVPAGPSLLIFRRGLNGALSVGTEMTEVTEQ